MALADGNCHQDGPLSTLGDMRFTEERNLGTFPNQMCNATVPASVARRVTTQANYERGLTLLARAATAQAA